MKANSKRAADEKYWNLSLKFAVDNLKVALVTLHREFGFGQERLTKFLDGVSETSKKYNEAFSDGVMDDIIDRDVEALHIPEEYLELLLSRRFDTMNEYHTKNRPRNNVSVREAAELRDKLEALRNFQTAAGIIKESDGSD